jgi:homoserine kinase
MQRDDEVYVGHMLDLSRKIASKIAGVRRQDFDRDENLRLALAHLLQTIGEAARRVCVNTRRHIRRSRGAGSSGRATTSYTTTWTWTRTSSGRPPSRRYRGALEPLAKG